METNLATGVKLDTAKIAAAQESNRSVRETFENLRGANEQPTYTRGRMLIEMRDSIIQLRAAVKRQENAINHPLTSMAEQLPMDDIKDQVECAIARSDALLALMTH